jgi:hypothetical protein
MKFGCTAVFCRRFISGEPVAAFGGLLGDLRTYRRLSLRLDERRARRRSRRLGNRLHDGQPVGHTGRCSIDKDRLSVTNGSAIVSERAICGARTSATF